MSRSMVKLMLPIALIVLALAQFSCGSSSQPSAQSSGSAGGPVDTGSGAGNSSSSNAGQVTVSGALNKTYSPVRVNIGQFGPSSMRLYLYEGAVKDLGRTPDTITIDIPADYKTGDYTFENSITTPNAKMYALYETQDGMNISFKNTKGKLTLTSAGSKYSGQFQFSAADPNDPSKTVDVSGSFSDLSPS